MTKRKHFFYLIAELFFNYNFSDGHIKGHLNNTWHFRGGVEGRDSVTEWHMGEGGGQPKFCPFLN